MSVRRTTKRQQGERNIPLITKGTLNQLASVPICAYVGYNGMGKSAAAASVAALHAEAGRPVLATARLVDWNNPRPCPDNGVCEWPSHGEDDHLAAHPMWRPLTDFRQIFTFRDGHIWLDEATGVADARSHQSMPSEVADYLPRLRAQQVTCHWTTIHWSFADVRLRRITWAALWAVGLMPKYVGEEIWGRNRLFLYRVYDAKNLGDDFDPAKRDEDVRPMIRSVVWGPSWSAFQTYRSLDGVASLGGTDASGMCMLCGGQRGKKRCTGHSPEEQADLVPLPRPGQKRLAVVPAEPDPTEVLAAITAPLPTLQDASSLRPTPPTRRELRAAARPSRRR